ncbi:ATP-binding cassette domain-containing protein [Streptomyces sp. ISL-86]|uniref:ATP-binding cassette domain-containing protein n=1 Tax=Streptomyces sp. ISL-86 TaxID=2819187 RepID=UPI001BEAB642|nr:ATP-binding cassette domain-containing protein [Streptomyces sp. ISL-86]MBT2459955.1 ATP-binding cassette domain-containing protein [Streptomyces sp. ISL-86]
MPLEMALRAARVRYGPLEALHGIDLPVPAGTLTLLLGRNGSGRTTVLRALAGSVPLSSGRVLWHGADVTRIRAHQRARRGLCFVPDREAVYPSLTVADNLGLFSPGARYDAALDAYPALAALLSRPAGTLSGGEQRMLALSRALLSADASVLLLDEPTQGMSPAIAARTYALLTTRAADSGAAVVLAEQRVPAALARAGVLVHELRRGAVVFSGEATERRPSEPTPRARKPEEPETPEAPEAPQEPERP